MINIILYITGILLITIILSIYYNTIETNKNNTQSDHWLEKDINKRYGRP